jgi:hypothetical protein
MGIILISADHVPNLTSQLQLAQYIKALEPFAG